jgi:hypothetical protein
LDEEVAQAQAKGLTVIYSFEAVPSWAGPAPNLAPSNWTYLSDFATALTTRYKGKIQYYEEFNEPDSYGAWADTYGNLVTFAQTVYQAIKAVDPNALVGAPTAAIQVYQPASSPTTGASNFVAWMQAYFQAGGNQYADFAGWHPYSCQIGKYGCDATIGCDKSSGNIIDCASNVIYNQTDQYRAMLNSVGLANIPLLDTEAGWGKDDGDNFCPNYTTTACFQSLLLEPAYVARFYILIASVGANGSAGVQTAYWYAWGTTGAFDNGGWGTLNGSDGQNPAAGVAYGQVYNWLVGSTFTNRCSAAGTVWTCPLTLAGGTPAELVWDASLSCTTSACATSSYTVPSGFTNYSDLTGASYVIPGESMQISASPILLTAPGIFSPPNASALTSDAQTFSWYPEPGATAYRLILGSSQGSNLYLDSGQLSLATTSYSVTGLPKDGSAVWARWCYNIGGTWSYSDYNYTATGGSAPAISSANNTTFVTAAGGAFTVTATGSPTPTIIENGALPAGVGFSGGVLSGTPLPGSAGVYSITFTASNGISPSAVQSFTLAVDQAPATTSGNSATFTVQTAGSFTVTASGLPIPAFSETGALPTGLSFADNGNGSATLSGTPQSGTAGPYSLTIVAANGVPPSAMQSFTLTVNQPPAITTGDNSTFTVGSTGSFTVVTSGYPTSAVSESGNLPGGVTFTDNGDGTATLGGTPATGTAGSYNLTITAANGVSPVAAQNFTLTVNEDAAITSGNVTTFTVGQAGTFTVAATGSPTPGLSESGTLPGGVIFTDNGNGSATLAGTPAAGTGGSYSLAITASNGVQSNANQSFTLTVNQNAAITSGNVTTFTLGQAGTFTITTTGSPTPSLSEMGALPLGVTFTDNGDGTATLAGTAAANTAGSYNFTITASNGVQPAAMQSFTLTVIQIPATPTVTFTGAPASASYQGTFVVSTTTTGDTVAVVSASGACAVTSSTGTSSLITMTSGSGTCSLTASSAADSNYTAASAKQSTSATKIAPTVSFAGAPATAAYSAKFVVSATTNASTAAVIKSSGSCSISGTQVTISALSGTCLLTANWVTDNNYLAASATQSTVATKAAVTINWNAPAAITYGTALSSTQLDATATFNGTTVAGTFAYTPAKGALLKAGAQPLSVTFTPSKSADFTGGSASVTLQVNQAKPKISWATPAAITYGTALSSTQLDATASVAGTLTYAPIAGTVLNAGTQALSVSFAPTDNTDYTAATGSVTLTVNKATPSVGWATPAPINYGTALGATQLDATAAYNGASVAGTFVYSPAGGKILAVGSQKLSVTFTPTNSANYKTAAGSVTLVVNRISSTTVINSSSPNPSIMGNKVTVHFSVTAIYGKPTGSVTVNASTRETCTGTLSSGSGTCSITFTSSGSRTLTGSYSGDSNDLTSSSATYSQKVNP